MRSMRDSAHIPLFISVLEKESLYLQNASFFDLTRFCRRIQRSKGGSIFPNH